MQAEMGFDLRGSDVLAANLEHVLEATEKSQPATRVKRPPIPGVKPAGHVELQRRLLGVAVVALADADAADRDLALLARPALDAGLGIDDADFSAGQRRAARGCGSSGVSRAAR
jgi:hypothetical protein